MDKQDILVTIINNIRSKKSLANIGTIERNFDLRNDLGLDSLDLAELTVRIEVEFDVDIFADGFVTTVGEIMDKIN
jgi:acyl carrier protein